MVLVCGRLLVPGRSQEELQTRRAFSNKTDVAKKTSAHEIGRDTLALTPKSLGKRIPRQEVVSGACGYVRLLMFPS